MKNWGYARHNLKTNAKLSLQQNILLCLKVTFVVILTQVFINWLTGALSVPVELSINQVKPVHSLVSMFEGMVPAAIATTVLLELAGIFLMAPLDLGTAGLYLKVVRRQGKDGEEIAFKSVFGWYLNFRESIKAFGLQLSVRLLMLFWIAVFCAPPAIWIYLIENRVQTSDIAAVPVSYAAAMAGVMLLFLAGLACAAACFFGYVPARFLMAQAPETGVLKAVAQSERLMRGHRWEYLMLELSFIPWYFLSLITFGLSLLYFIPYRSACQAVFIRKLQFEKLAEKNAAAPAGGRDQNDAAPPPSE